MFKAVYVLTSSGDDIYACMVRISMISMRSSNPEWKITLLCDSETKRCLDLRNHPLLNECDSVRAIDVPEGNALFRSRWLKTQVGLLIQGCTLFIDADTLVRGRLAYPELFTGDIGAVYDGLKAANVERPELLAASREMGWDEKLPYFNSGVFSIRPSTKTNQFFKMWHTFWLDYCQQTGGRDQPSFNAALQLSECNLVPLNDAYNKQLWLSWKDCAEARIWHFWQTTGDQSHILAELINDAANCSNTTLSNRIINAARRPTPSPSRSLLAKVLRALNAKPESQRKILIQRSRLDGFAFFRWVFAKALRFAP